MDGKVGMTSIATYAEMESIVCKNGETLDLQIAVIHAKIIAHCVGINSDIDGSLTTTASYEMNGDKILELFVRINGESPHQHDSQEVVYQGIMK